jgi:hypothetical protein
MFFGLCAAAVSFRWWYVFWDIALSVIMAVITFKGNMDLGLRNDACLALAVPFFQFLYALILGHIIGCVTKGLLKKMLGGMLAGIMGYIIGMNQGTGFMKDLNLPFCRDPQLVKWQSAGTRESAMPSQPQVTVPDCLLLSDGNIVAVDGKSCECWDKHTRSTRYVCESKPTSFWSSPFSFIKEKIKKLL